MTHRFTTLRLALGLALLLLLTPGCASDAAPKAGEDYRVIRGKVVNKKGKPIKSVEISYKDREGVIRPGTETDQSGSFEFPVPGIIFDPPQGMVYFVHRDHARVDLLAGRVPETVTMGPRDYR